MIKYVITIALMFMVGCSDKGTTSATETVSTEGSATVEIIAGKVGALAKVAHVAEIQLQTLIITLTAPDEDTILDTLAASGNEQLFYNKVYAGLASLKTWTLSVQSVDIEGVIIHQGATSFDVLVGANVDVTLDLDAEYSMLVANFNPIQDSVTRVELVVDAAVVATGAVVKQGNIGGTETLEYDYLSTGSTHAITMNVYGDMWGFDTILYTGDTIITAIAAQDTTYEILLHWVGPDEAYTGQATMSVTLGAVGTVLLNGTLESSYRPRQVVAGIRHTMVLTADGTLWATGGNSVGQLGDGTTVDKSTPFQVMTGVASVAAGEYHTMILKTDGSLWATGQNSYGQLGDGTTVDKSTPVQIMSDVQDATCGDKHTMIIKTDGSLWTTGQNSYGQLGDGTTVDKSTPFQVMTSVASVDAGDHTMILKTDGSLWAMGFNYFGQFGNGEVGFGADASTPIEIMTGVQDVAAGSNYTMMLKTDGTLWAVGENGFGQLGDGTTVDKGTPVQVMTGVASVSTYYHHTMIVKLDGTLWATGWNTSGQFGDGTIVSKSTLVQVMTGVQDVVVGGGHTTIVKLDGTLWATGANTFGQLGDGTTVSRSTPIEIDLFN